MEAENRTLLVEGSKAFGIHLDLVTVDVFDHYLGELLKWNQKINLTAIRTEKGIILKHFLDSLSVCPYLPKAASLLDIGSGAGFPGIPLKIVQPSLEITLIDSVLKKVDFQRHVIRACGLKGIEAIHGRVQEKAIPANMEGRYDIVISRALTQLNTFLSLSYPFLRKRGLALAMRGTSSEEESKEESHYRLQKAVSFSLPSSSLKRSLLIFEKQ
jgi:16S rRNA (guanine527-N7)-methyltransferase